MRPWREKLPNELFSEMLDRWNVFPSVGLVLPGVKTAGAYCAFNQVISLPTMQEETWRRARAGTYPAVARRVLPLLAHEQRHFADHVSSVWGRESLLELFNAYDIRADGRLKEYAKVADAIRGMNRDQCTDYYTEYQEAAYRPPPVGRWRVNRTCGFELSLDGSLNKNRPVMFTRFHTPEDEYMCRVPFSVGSLLEVRAMAAEFCLKAYLIRMCVAKVREAEMIMLSDDMGTVIYEPLLSLYSVMAHYFANVLPEWDIFGAYVKAAHVAWLCLNMPRPFFSDLRFSPEFWEATEVTDVSPREIHEHFVRLYDRAYLFLLIAYAGRGEPTEGDMDGWLKVAVKKAGLPSLETIREAADEECASHSANLSRLDLRDRLTRLFDYGMEVRATGPDSVFSPPNLNHCPAVLLDDCTFALPRGGLEGDSMEDFQKWFRDSADYKELIREFIDACAL